MRSGYIHDSTCFQYNRQQRKSVKIVFFPAGLQWISNTFEFSSPFYVLNWLKKRKFRLRQRFFEDGGQLSSSGRYSIGYNRLNHILSNTFWWMKISKLRNFPLVEVNFCRLSRNLHLFTFANICKNIRSLCKNVW